MLSYCRRLSEDVPGTGAVSIFQFSCPVGMGVGTGTGSVSIPALAKAPRTAVEDTVLKGVLCPRGCGHRPESLDLATGLPSASLPVSPLLAAWFHRAEDAEPSEPFMCPFSPNPVLPMTELPTI